MELSFRMLERLVDFGDRADITTIDARDREVLEIVVSQIIG